MIFCKQNIFMDRLINEVIRLIDTRQSEINYAKIQIGANWIYYNLKIKSNYFTYNYTRVII